MKFLPVQYKAMNPVLNIVTKAPFPMPYCLRMFRFKVMVWSITQSCLALCNLMKCSLARLLHPWNFPGKDTGVGCYSLLQRIFSTQGSNTDLLNCRQVLYCLSHQVLRSWGMSKIWPNEGPWAKEGVDPHTSIITHSTIRLHTTQSLCIFVYYLFAFTNLWTSFFSHWAPPPNLSEWLEERAFWSRRVGRCLVK